MREYKNMNRKVHKHEQNDKLEGVYYINMYKQDDAKMIQLRDRGEKFIYTK